MTATDPDASVKVNVNASSSETQAPKSPQESNLKATIAKIYVDSHTEYPDMRAKDWPDVFADKILEAFAKHQQALLEDLLKKEELCYDCQHDNDTLDNPDPYIPSKAVRSALQKIREEI